MMTSSATIRERSDQQIRSNSSVVFHAAGMGLRPDPVELVSEWARKFRVVPDMGSVPGRWDNSTAPYLIEIMDALSPDSDVKRVVLLKPAQSGGSAVAENWLGFLMHRAPGPIMYIGPTVLAAKDWYEEKLGPTIQASDVLNPEKGGAVYPHKARNGEGSTGKRLKFRGGFLYFAGANSAATLRQHSIRYMVRDDRSAWTDNADNEGDPKDLSDMRLKTYRRFDLEKVFDVSSPKFKGADIDADFDLGDKRRYYMVCLGCGALNDWDWEDVVKAEAAPFRSRMICPACNREHSEADKPDMVSVEAGACWIPTAHDADGVVPPKTIPMDQRDEWRLRDTGKPFRSYVITGVINTFDRWDDIAQAEAEAGDDPEKVQPFQNGVLGRGYAPKGEGPSWELLAARRDSEWERGRAPAGVLYVTLTADVQGDGIYWAFIGWGPNKEGWHLDHGFCAGATDIPFEGAWPKLDAVADRGIAFGPSRLGADLIGVDSGYNSDAVYSWVKRRHNALALKGVDGWSKLPIFRAETPEVKKTGLSAGKARRHGMKVWMVGTWGIKAALMIYLARLPKEGGGVPTGYQHFPGNAEEEYFHHLSSEFIKEEKDEAGTTTRKWAKKGPNHWLDCNVYAWALAHFAGLWAWSETQWDARAKELAELMKVDEFDLFSPGVVAAIAAAPIRNEADAEPAPAPTIGSRRAVAPDDGLAALANLNR